MASKKGIGLTVGILIAIAGASFIFWAVPQQNSMTFIVTDFENHLDGIKAKHNIISSGLKNHFRKCLMEKYHLKNTLVLQWFLHHKLIH